MASEPILDIDALLAPISDENPTGSDLRDDESPLSTYNTIKDARQAARSAERQNMFDGHNTEADDYWRKIIDLAPDIIKNSAKDLEVASWLTEALIRRNGFRGLRDGFQLIQRLIDTFWDDLYPMPDEDGIETRVASLSGLNGEGAEGVLIAPIRNAIITEGADPGPFTLWNYQQAADVDKALDTDTKNEKEAKLGFSIGHIERAVAESSEAFFVNLRDDINDAITSYREASKKLDELCGLNDAPPTSNILNILEQCQGVVNHLGKHKFPAIQTSDASESDEDTISPGTTDQVNAPQHSTGPIKSRDDAFRQLTEIADYFRRSEPHSPIAHILERAVKWGDMPLEALIRELIPDSSARDFYSSLTGVRIADDD